LIIPSKVSYIPKEYIEYIKSNYENYLISYRNMFNCFKYIGLDPILFGFEFPEEEEDYN